MTRHAVRTPLRALVSASLVLAITSPAPAERLMLQPMPAGLAPAGAGAAGQTVGLPYVMRDNVGVTWDVQQDGSIGDGGNDLYDGASKLTVGGQQFNPQMQVAFNQQANELTFAAQTFGSLRVSRRVAVNAAAGWCRYVELIENPTAAPARASLRLNFDMGQGIQQQQQVEDPKKRTPLGIAVFDGRRAVAMLAGGPGGKAQGRYAAQPNSDQCDLTIDVDVPAKQTAAVVHFQAMRGSMADATAFMTAAKEKELLGDLPKEIRRAVVNFRRAGGDAVIADIELPRADLLDTIELRTGDVYRGALSDAAFKLDTFHGPVELPVERVIGMLTVGTHRPTQLFVTADGEIVGGTLAGGALKMRLSGGQEVALPLAAIAKVGCRKRPGEPEEIKLDKPMALLRDGQRLIVDPPAGPVTVSTLYGRMEIKPEALAAILFHGEEQAVHQVRLRDGSRFSAVVAGDALDLRLRGAGSGNASASAPAVKVPLASLSRLQVTPQTDDAADAADAPTLTLGNGDVLVGSAAGVLELETAFDVLKMDGAGVRSIRHVEPPENGRALPAELTIGLWDGATVSGRLKGDAVDFALGGGATVRVPVALIDRYAHPRPSAPPDMVTRIREIVKQLDDPDWKKRDRAADQLRSLGQAAAGVLTEMRDGQPPETRKQIDTILKGLEREKGGSGKPQ